MEHIVSPGFRLGKRAVKHDKRTLKFADYISSVPTPPAMIDWGQKVSDWPMMRNDQLGDCTCAAAGHLIQSWTADFSNIFVPTDDEVIEAYEAVSGYDPKTGANDDGAAELDVLNYWRKTGIADHKIDSYAQIGSGTDKVKQAIWLFGGAYLGILLPASAQGQTLWDIPSGGLNGSGAPGSWGGHAVPAIAYDAQTVTVITWGQRLKMSWAFYLAYCDEAYAVLSQDWVTQNNPAPSGFDMVSLQQDLQAVA